jgi:plastocyanin
MALAAVGAALLLGGSPSAGVRAQSTVDVRVEAFVFEPATLTVPAGTTVVWHNFDAVTHTVTDFDQLYDSGEFIQPTPYARIYSEPGVYEYYCIPHPTMIGRIEVTG